MSDTSSLAKNQCSGSLRALGVGDPTSILLLNGQQSVLSFSLNAYISAHRLV